MRPVKEGERVVAKAKVTNLNENGRTVVEVNSYVGQELVFQGEFHMYRSNVVKRMEKKMKSQSMPWEAITHQRSRDRCTKGD